MWSNIVRERARDILTKILPSSGSIRRRLFFLLGAKIDMESKVGKGSTFTVTIPRSPEGEEKHEAKQVF